MFWATFAYLCPIITVMSTSPSPLATPEPASQPPAPAPTGQSVTFPMLAVMLSMCPC